MLARLIELKLAHSVEIMPKCKYVEGYVRSFKKFILTTTAEGRDCPPNKVGHMVKQHFEKSDSE